MKKHVSRIIGIMVAGAMAMTSLAGCGGGSDSNGNATTDTAPEETTEVATETSTEAATEEKNVETETAESEIDYSETLIIYTNSGTDGRSEWLTEKAAEAGFSVNVMHLGGSELTERLIAEKNNQIADLVFGLNAMNFERIKAQDIIIPYTPAWVDEIDINLGDAEDGYYYPLVIQALLQVYNTDVYTEDTAPKDFTDLQMGSEYENLHHILALTGGTCQAIMASLLVRYADESGELGISDEGWAVVESFVKSGQINNDDWWNDLVAGDVPVAMFWSSGLLQYTSEYGTENVAYTIPEIGSPFVVEQVAICNNSDKQDLSQAFIDWFGSAEVQAGWAQEFGSYPANQVAQASASKEAQDLMSNLTQQDIDWGFVADNIEAWMEKIMLEFV